VCLIVGVLVLIVGVRSITVGVFLLVFVPIQ
jgi:hypothetical protein